MSKNRIWTIIVVTVGGASLAFVLLSAPGSTSENLRKSALAESAVTVATIQAKLEPAARPIPPPPKDEPNRVFRVFTAAERARIKLNAQFIVTNYTAARASGCVSFENAGQWIKALTTGKGVNGSGRYADNWFRISLSEAEVSMAAMYIESAGAGETLTLSMKNGDIEGRYGV